MKSLSPSGGGEKFRSETGVGGQNENQDLGAVVDFRG
jgi:hypothetical protein